jgi:hypothetical protein
MQTVQSDTSIAFGIEKALNLIYLWQCVYWWLSDSSILC